MSRNPKNNKNQCGRWQMHRAFTIMKTNKRTEIEKDFSELNQFKPSNKIRCKGGFHPAKDLALVIYNFKN